jgi:hypothetical protein
MKPLKISFLCLFYASVFAQEPGLFSESSNSEADKDIKPEVQTFSSYQTSKSPTLAKQEENVKVEFSNVRSQAYGLAASGNPATHSSVVDLTLIPSLLAGKSFVYLEPGSMKNNAGMAGMVAFPMGSNTAFLKLDNSSTGEQGILSIGQTIAGGKIGLGLRTSLDYQVTKVRPKGSEEVETSVRGKSQQLGAFGSVSLGEMEVYSSVDLNQTSADTTTTNREDNHLQILFTAGVRTKMGESYMDLGLVLDFHPEEQHLTSGGTETIFIEANSYQAYSLFANYGKRVGLGDNFEVYIGNNSSAIFTQHAEDRDSTRSKINGALITAPNIFFEYAFTSDFFLFSGISQSIVLFNYAAQENLSAGNTLDSENISMVVNSSNSIATAGFRWQWKALAFETSLAASFWDDGSSAVFNGSGLLSNSSLILNF